MRSERPIEVVSGECVRFLHESRHLIGSSRTTALGRQAPVAWLGNSHASAVDRIMCVTVATVNLSPCDHAAPERGKALLGNGFGDGKC